MWYNGSIEGYFYHLSTNSRVKGNYMQSKQPKAKQVRLYNNNTNLKFPSIRAASLFLEEQTGRGLASCKQGLMAVLDPNKGSTTVSGWCASFVEDRNLQGLTGHYLYQTWSSMKQRCTNKKNPAYPDYGGRGITICDRWLSSFANFLEDMGDRGEGLSLDRVDNDKGYSPDNCRWATKKQQSNNTRVSQRVNQSKLESLRESIPYIRGESDLEDLIGEYRKYPLIRLTHPLSIKPLSQKQYFKVYKLSQTVMGYNYTYHTIDSLCKLWGCDNRRYISMEIKALEKCGAIMVLSKRRGEWLIEVNALYCWRGPDEYGREQAIEDSKYWGNTCP